MSMHSEGPWKQDGSRVLDANNRQVCECRRTADTHLIAMAPNLLEATKKLYELSLTAQHKPTIALLEDLIDRAEGVK